MAILAVRAMGELWQIETSADDCDSSLRSMDRGVFKETESALDCSADSDSRRSRQRHRRYLLEWGAEGHWPSDISGDNEIGVAGNRQTS
jgi:hypothetical protein